MDVTVGFSRSERSRNNFGGHSNCSGRIFYGREKWIGLDQNTLPPIISRPIFQLASPRCGLTGPVIGYGGCGGFLVALTVGQRFPSHNNGSQRLTLATILLEGNGGQREGLGTIVAG